MALRARDIMTTRVVTVRADAPLARAEQLFKEYSFSALPVLDRSSRLVGIISGIDILRHRADRGTESGDAIVADVMTADVITMKPDANISILTHRLRAYGELRVMPIVDRGHLVGVITRSDLLRPRRRGSPLARAAGWAIGTARGGAAKAEESATLTAARRPPRHESPDWNRELNVADVMTAGDLITARADMSTDQAIDLLTKHRFSSLPVVSGDGKLVGLVSEADLLRDPLDGRRSTRARTVGGAMTREVVTVPPEASVQVLLGEFVERGLRVVPVVSRGRLVGIVSRSDLL
ncbi:CBS domain-containing protein [Pseudonocardia sp. CA-107938]|uniref:CBS domain-containing protein n=1 Tax=Pseudonocardia sp. CA-107938 TaxID=3240021 RepID=UPI003D90CDA5